MAGSTVPPLGSRVTVTVSGKPSVVPTPAQSEGSETRARKNRLQALVGPQSSERSDLPSIS